jgi:UPF0148 protein
MPSRKEDEIMAGYLLKGGKMLEKTCRTCGCPLFEVKGSTFCVVCAENEKEKTADKKPATAVAGPVPAHQHGAGCMCESEHDEDTCTCGDEDGGLLAEEIAMTVHALCERVHNEKDPAKVLALMQAVKAGTEALEIVCRL